MSAFRRQMSENFGIWHPWSGIWLGFRRRDVPTASADCVRQSGNIECWKRREKNRCRLIYFPDPERRWSSRRFPYGYLVTTSPQSLTLPWSAASLRLANRLQVKPTSMAWRAVCTRPGNVFTAACWSAITSDSNFMHSSCRVQSELRWLLGISSSSRFRCPLSPPL